MTLKEIVQKASRTIKENWKEVAAASLMATANMAPAQEINTVASHQAIAPENKEPIYRVELFSHLVPNQLPLNADIYFTWEGTEGKKTQLARLQLLTNTGTIANIGPTAQYVDVGPGKISQEYGITGRLSDMSGPIKFKVDMRAYFAELNSNDMTRYIAMGFVNHEKFRIEGLAAYQPKLESGFFRSKWDYKINKHLQVGLETKHLFTPEGPKSAYKGLRIQLNI
ncbi:hypothetical protein H8D36_01530 [archaeon]|nr:hypothetical protein [archaeon]MBL7057172.1 hypothetical protein [Candidatus Woesearchaeota archaeon]